MTNRAWAWVIVAASLAWMVVLSGCAGFDEYKCGPGYAYTNGQCRGMGRGFTMQVLDPETARMLSQAAR